MSLVTYLSKDIIEFPNLVEWYNKIVNNSEYLIIRTDNYYFIIKPSKNRICRVESLNPKIHLNDILEEIDKYLSKIQQVYVPLGKPNVIDSFVRNGFKIKGYIQDKYVKGKSVFLMEKIK